MKGKKGVTIALNMVGVAILTMAVVLVVGAIFYDHAPAIADSTIGPLKHIIGIGNPEILDLRIEQSSQNSRGFNIHYEIGNLDSLKEAKIVKVYKKYENSDPIIIINSDWDIDVDTLKDRDGLGSITDRPEAGYNEYEIILIGDEKISKSELVKVYDENYLEMHNTTLGRCPHTMLETVIQLGGGGGSTTDGKMWKPLAIRGVIHYDNKQCDVIECKKNGLTVKHPNYRVGNNDDWPLYCFVATKAYLKLVSEEFGRGPGVSGGCGDFAGDTQNTESSAYLRSEGCSDNQINELSKRMVTVHFIAAACEIIALRNPSYLDEIRDEGLNINDIHLSDDDLQIAKESAIGMTMACTRGHEEVYRHYSTWGDEGYINIPGTLSHFTNEGFIQIGHLTEHEESINETFLEDIRPVFVTYLVGEYTTQNENMQNEKRFGAVWKIIGHEKVNRIEVDHCWSKYAIDKDFLTDENDNLIESVSERDIECQTYAESQVEEGFNAKRFENPKPGMYIATFRIETNEGEVITRTAKGGIYNQDYLEEYNGVVTYKDKLKKEEDERDLITVCVENPKAGSYDYNENDKCGDGKGERNLAECNKECNVIQKKLDAFRIEDAPGDPNNRPPDTEEYKIHNNTFSQWKNEKERDGQSTECIFKHHQTDRTGADRHYYLLDRCSPEEVNELYDLLLRKAVSEIGYCDDIGTTYIEHIRVYPHCNKSFYDGDDNPYKDCVKEMEKLFGIKKDELKEVCNAKEKLRDNLVDDLEWRDLLDTY